MQKYPTPPKGIEGDTYHGEYVPDPYRELESLESPATQRWLAEQDEIAHRFFARIPQRAQIRQRLADIMEHEKLSVPQRRQNRLFYYRKLPGEQYFSLCVQNLRDPSPTVIIDPLEFHHDGPVSISFMSASPCGEYVAYGLSVAGSDWQQWRVRHVTSKQDLPERIDWVKFTLGAWLPDSSGFFYSRFNPPDDARSVAEVSRTHKLYFHKLHSPQSDDVLVFHRPEHPDTTVIGRVTTDGRYLLVIYTEKNGNRNEVLLRSLAEPGAPFKAIFEGYSGNYVYVGSRKERMYFRTDYRAPNGKVIEVEPLENREFAVRVIIPECEQSLERASVLADRFFVTYIQDVHHEVRIFDAQGKPIGAVETPGVGTVLGFDGKETDDSTYFSYTDFVTPHTMFHYDIKKHETALFRKPATRFDPDSFTVRRVFYSSKDGTRVPMFIAHRSDIDPSDAPCYLYGYGGFNVALTPEFLTSRIAWIEMGGVFVVANIRGGSEYGEKWHGGGMLRKKQNSLDDFIAAAEYLIKNRYSHPRKLAIGGRSNGGLLTAACMIQRPELFAAVMIGVGVLDMLRFDKFTIGWAFKSDYGAPQDAEDYKVLRSYSPLHNLRPGIHYPPTLIVTSDKDDRVFPGHSYKFAAAMQACQTGPNPVILRVSHNIGHGAGMTTENMLDEAADLWSFLSEIPELQQPLRAAG